MVIWIWKFSLLIDLENVLGPVSEVHCSSEDGSTLKTRRPRTMRQIEVDLNFTNFLGKTLPDIFAPPKNHKSLLLPENRSVCVTKLPEDCHYEPENLVKLFLLPNVKVCSLDIEVSFNFDYLYPD
jgi:condensin complex subunit 2